MEKQKTVSELRRGEFFTLRPIPFPRDSQVYVRGEYDRSSRRFWADKFDDIGAGRLLKATTPVYTDFEF